MTSPLCALSRSDDDVVAVGRERLVRDGHEYDDLKEFAMPHPVYTEMWERKVPHALGRTTPQHLVSSSSSSLALFTTR
jgi:hypothetical protein